MTEYHVDAYGKTFYFTTPEEAYRVAIGRSLSTGEPCNIDVIAYSEDDAKSFAGDDGVERYRDDPDASVFERIVIRAESLGMIH